MNIPGFDRKKAKSRLAELPVDALRAGTQQPRKTFDGEELDSLAASIRQNGILQPLLVRRCGSEYEVIAGERRLRAAKLAGAGTVPCMVVEMEDRDAAVCSLLENLQRQDLSCFEEAEAIARLISEFGMTQAQAAERLGKQQSTIANKLRLLRFSPAERSLIGKYQLSERHARALLRIEDEAARRQLLQEIGEKELTVAKTEARVEQLLSGQRAGKKPARAIVVVKDVRIFFNTVAHALEIMRRSGIDASEEQNETEDCIEYVIRIPKQAACKERSA
ncbi:MAG: ParB/RepB/Spo0J family partition protein [Firmicutes bacterium]|nr:ParB/RepB/Spo0J family partition protein [Bacillota bacterium]